MIQKLVLAAAVCVGSLAFTSSSAEAGDCYGRRGYSASYGYGYRAPVAVPRYSYNAYRPVYGVPRYPSYRYGYGGYGYRPGFSVGYSNFGYGPYRRGGVSVGFGF